MMSEEFEFSIKIGEKEIASLQQITISDFDPNEFEYYMRRGKTHYFRRAGMNMKLDHDKPLMIKYGTKIKINYEY